MTVEMHVLFFALVLQLAGIETVTTAADHYDKYASIAFGREGTMWIAYASMHGDETSIVVRSKSGGRWSGEERLDCGEGFEGNPRLIVDRSGNLWAFWHGRRNDRWPVGIDGVARRLAPVADGVEDRLPIEFLRLINTIAAIRRSG